MEQIKHVSNQSPEYEAVKRSSVEVVVRLPIQSEPEEQQPAASCNCQGLRKYRQAHAAIGLWLALYLVAHLLLCALGVFPERYSSAVVRIHAVIDRFPYSQAFAIFLPLAMQLVLGVYLLFKEGLRYNVKKCGRGNKLQSFLQRMTALVLIAFFVFHIGTLHQWGFHLLSRFFGWEFLKPFASGGIFSTANVYGSTVHGIRFLWSTTEPDHVLNWFFAVFTLLGAWAAVYHVANGLWSGGLVWKLFQTEESKKRWGQGCVILGIVLGLLVSVAWGAFALRSTFA